MDQVDYQKCAIGIAAAVPFVIFSYRHKRRAQLCDTFRQNISDGVLKTEPLNAASKGRVFLERRVKIFQTTESSYVGSGGGGGAVMPIIAGMYENKSLKHIEANTEYRISDGVLGTYFFVEAPLIDVNWDLHFNLPFDVDSDSYVRVSRAFFKDDQAHALVTDYGSGEYFVHGVVEVDNDDTPEEHLCKKSEGHDLYFKFGLTLAALSSALAVSYIMT